MISPTDVGPVRVYAEVTTDLGRPLLVGEVIPYTMYQMMAERLTETARIGGPFGARDVADTVRREAAAMHETFYVDHYQDRRVRLAGQAALDTWWDLALHADHVEGMPLPSMAHHREGRILAQVIMVQHVNHEALSEWAGGELDPMVLGCGHYGCAFAVAGRPDVVVKITFDATEPHTWAFVGKAQQRGERWATHGFARVYRIVRLQWQPYRMWDWTSHGSRELSPYAILRENAEIVDLTAQERSAVMAMSHSAWGSASLTKGGLTRRVNAYVKRAAHYGRGRLRGVMRGLATLAQEHRFLIPKLNPDGVAMRKVGWKGSRKGSLIIIDPGHPPAEILPEQADIDSLPDR